MTDPNQRGDVAEINCKAKLIEEGYNIYEPIREGDRVDLVVEKDNNLLKVQIKSANYYEGKVRFKTKSEMTHRTHKYEGQDYEGDIDYFMAYCPKLDRYYWVEIEDAPSTGMELRVEDPKKHSPNINWAEDYRFPV